MNNSFIIKKLSEIDDFEQAMDVQRKAWNIEDRDLLPSHFMIEFKEYGEQWGTFIGNKLIAIALAYPTNCNGIYLLQMLAALPEYRHLGVDSNLLNHLISILKDKNAKKIYWTYNPFDFANSHLYLTQIKAIGTTVLFNYYGILNSVQHGQFPTHRLLCEINFKPINFWLKEKIFSIPMNEKKILTLESAEANKIVNDWFTELSKIISDDWVVTNFELSDDNETGKFTLNKKQFKNIKS
ncbi:MAG: GNAT family N-acetyltransferase [Prevotellaceae bacterium]|jgi:predicted GNAT superfamily acetyltransferase|nr:GNAT family N-acetyltransferase [Prevotellaceae bacterium]